MSLAHDSHLVMRLRLLSASSSALSGRSSSRTAGQYIERYKARKYTTPQKRSGVRSLSDRYKYHTHCGTEDVPLVLITVYSKHRTALHTTVTVGVLGLVQ
jgi:hypothetical protein